MRDEHVTNPGLRIEAFISHAHVDREIAERLLGLLLELTTLEASQIRCTSVPRHQIPNNETITDRLRRDVDGALAFLGLLSEEALDSTWVKFELGAAWGRMKDAILILGPGISHNDERLGPMGSVPHIAIDDADAAESLQARLEQQAQHCGFYKSVSGAGVNLIREFVAAFRQLGGATEDFSNVTTKVQEPVAVEGAAPSLIRTKVEVAGTFRDGWDGFLWACAYAEGIGLFWPKHPIPCVPGTYEISFPEGGKIGRGGIQLAVVGCGRSGNRRVEQWLQQSKRAGHCADFTLADFIGGKVLVVAGSYQPSS
jgi:hypothetical protein